MASFRLWGGQAAVRAFGLVHMKLPKRRFLNNPYGRPPIASKRRATWGAPKIRGSLAKKSSMGSTVESPCLWELLFIERVSRGSPHKAEARVYSHKGHYFTYFWGPVSSGVGFRVEGLGFWVRFGV